MNLDQLVNSKDLSADDMSHTSGIGFAGAGGRSLDARRALEQKRKHVRSYHQSRLGASFTASRPRTAEESMKWQNQRQPEGQSDPRMQARNESMMHQIERSQAPVRPAPRNFGQFGN